MRERVKYFLVCLTLIMCVTKSVNSITVGSCIQYSLDGSRCQKCIQNYHNFDGRCYVDILGCRVYNFGNICLECQKNYILVNNYCCDKTCISQMYKDGNSTLSSGDISRQESQRLQDLLTKIKKEIFLTQQIRVSSISLQKYKDVVRYYFLYENLNEKSTWRRIIYDCHTLWKQYIWVDDSTLSSQLNFQLIPYQPVTNFEQVKRVLSQFSDFYSQVDPSLTIVKEAQVNKVRQFQVLVHNQNSLKAFYHCQMNNKTVLLYDITLAPQYFKIILMENYLTQSFNSIKFLQHIKSMLDKNSTYVNTSIKAVQIYNSSSVNEPLKVLIFSQGQSVVIKTMFEVFYSSVQAISQIKIVSSKTQSKQVSRIIWATYLGEQNVQIQKAIQLILSGYNSSKEIPLNYTLNKQIMKQIQFECKIQKWKVFTRYHFLINTKTWSMQVKVIKIDSLNEYRIQRLMKVQTISKPLVSTVSKLVENFTVNQSLGLSYQRTIQGWSLIEKKLDQSLSIKAVIQWFILREQYKVMGNRENITKLVQKVSKNNDTHLNYTIIAENSTYYMKAIISTSNNINSTDSSTLPKILSVQYMQKQQKDFIKNYLNSTLNATHHFKDNSSIGVKVYYSYNSKWTIFTNFTYPYANSLQNKFRDAYRKSRNTSGIYTFEDMKLLDSYIINSTYSTVPTNFIVEYNPCPTSPYTEYIWIFNYNKTGNICHEMRFLQITQNLTKKIIINGYTYTHSDSGCNYTYKFSFNSSLNNILPKDSFSSTGIFTRMYFRGTAVTQTFNFNITQMNSTFQTFMKTKYSNNSEINRMYSNFKSQQIYALEMFNRYTPYIRWDKFRTDSMNNVSYQLISYIPSHYFKNKTIPSYSGSFNREYHHVCVGLNTSRLFDEVLWRNKFTNDSQWVKPNVTDWYALIMGKQNVYNTGFVQNTSQLESIVNNSQPQEQVKEVDSLRIKNESLKLLQYSMMNTLGFNNTLTTTSYSIRQMMVIDYLFYRLYLMKVSITSTMSVDMIVLYNKSVNSNNTSRQSHLIELVSYMGSNTFQMQKISIKRSIVYKLINTNNNLNDRLSYLQDIIHSQYVQYLLNKFQQIDIKLNQLIQPKIILSLLSMNVANTPNTKDTITLNKLYYSKQSLNNETVIIKIIYQINNIISSIKYYYSGSYLMKYNLTKDTLINTTYGMYNLYLLQYRIININNINNNDSVSKDNYYQLYTTTTIQSTIINQIITNYTLPILFNFYNNSTTNTNTNTTSSFNNNNNNIISNSSYFNVVTYSNNNISEGIQKFTHLTSQTGKLLQDGQLVQLKYYPSINLINTNVDMVDNNNITNPNNNYNQYTKISLDLPNKILTIIQSKYKQKLYEQNITSTILIIEKLSDPQQFISYSILIKSTLKYYNTTSSLIQTKIHLLRFTYLMYKQYFTSMGQTTLSNALYQIVTRDIKNESVLYFEPMKRVSYLNYLSSFIQQVIKLVNSYLLVNNINQRVVLIEELFYRSYLKGGFYKVYLSLESNKTAIGYILEENYQYKVMRVKIIPVTVNNNNASSESDMSNMNNQLINNNNLNTNTNESNINNMSNSIQQNDTVNETTIITNTSNNSTESSTSNNSILNQSNNSINNNTTKQQPSDTISYSSLLQQQIFNTQSQNIYILYLRQILTKLNLQYNNYLYNQYLTAYSISQSIDGQFYSLTYQLYNININNYINYINTTIYNNIKQTSDIVIYRCNSTCLQYNGINSSLFILTFIKIYSLKNGTIIDIQDITNNLTLFNSNSNTLLNKEQSIQTITQSFYYSNHNNNTLNNNTQSSSYYIPVNQQQQLMSIFQSIYNQQSITTIDPLLLNYQKYLLFIKQHLSSILYSRQCKIIDKVSMNQQTNYIIRFITQRYSLVLNQSILLMIVQNTHLINNHTQYSLYFVKQHNQLLKQKQWIIYIVNVSSTEVYNRNYHIEVIYITQWAKNNQLTNNRTSLISTNSNYNNKVQQTDIAFGYVPVNNIDSLNQQPDFIQIMQQLNNKYSSLVNNRTITKAQKLQLKNGTTTYKLFFTDNNTMVQSSLSPLDTVKVIAVYRKDQHRVQILNKLYLPNQIYLPVQLTQLNNNHSQLINNTIALIQQLHSKQISSHIITVTKIEVTAQSPSTYKQIQRYKLQLTLPTGKSYSTIVDYNPIDNQLNQVSFNQIIQLPKDSMYRLNVFEKQHSQEFTQIQQTDWIKDNLYQIALNKIKTLNNNYINTLLVYKKSQSFTSLFKVIYQSNDNSTHNQQINSTILQKKFHQILISVNPSEQKVQSLQSAYKLNLTQGFLPVKQWQISQQQLMSIINEFRSMYNISANSPMLVNSTMKKIFLNGILLKILLFVKAQDNITRSYEILAYHQFYVNKFTLWTVTSLLPYFQSSCSSSQTCTQCKNQVDYQLYQNKVCTLKINHCKTYLIDITKNILLCQQCLHGYQLLDNKCLQQLFYPELWK